MYFSGEHAERLTNRQQMKPSDWLTATVAVVQMFKKDAVYISPLVNVLNLLSLGQEVLYSTVRLEMFGSCFAHGSYGTKRRFSCFIVYHCLS